MRAQGGEATVNDLRDHLIQNGEAGDPKDVYRKIYATLLRNNRFYRSAPGKFGLIPRGESYSSSGGTFVTKIAAESWDGDLRNVVRAIAKQ
jgi:hypothetical protein